MMDASVFVYFALALIGGYATAYQLSRACVVRGLGEKPQIPAAVWPCLPLLLVTLVGAIPAIGLVMRKGWARWLALVYLLGLAMVSLVGAMVVKALRDSAYWHLHPVRLQILSSVVVGAPIIAVLCIVSVALLFRPEVKAWFEGNS